MEPDVTLTLGLLDKGRELPNGHWNAAQLALFGIKFPPVGNWRALLVGRSVSAAVYRRFLALKGEAGNLRKRKSKATDQTPSLFD